MEKGRSGFKILTENPIGRRSSVMSRRKWKDKIRMNLKEIAVNMRNWIDSAQDIIVELL